jgi:hypothetical protein
LTKFNHDIEPPYNSKYVLPKQWKILLIRKHYVNNILYYYKQHCSNENKSSSIYQNTNEWINGILPIQVNRINQDTTGTKKYWIMFDGPVDTLWIEDMNSSLDDSKKLCLPSSAIIVLSSELTLM